MNENLVLIAIFLSVLLIVFAAVNYLTTRREMRRNLEAAGRSGTDRRAVASKELDAVLTEENDTVRYYFEVLRNDDKDSMRSRMIRAGYFSRSAPRIFNTIRVIIALAVFLGVWAGVRAIAPAVRPGLVILLAMMVSGVVFIVVNIVLDRLGTRKETQYRRLFPDFMDLLIVCIDAGLGVDSAIDRVTREYLVTNRDFGTHLSIIVLELRAGRPLHEALNNFAKRVNLEEAQSLAILFRQSIELGTSVGKTLRVFSGEMRTRRILLAEEKANKLPVKMLFPLAIFLFPVNMVIVIVPVLISILQMFISLAPS